VPISSIVDVTISISGAGFPRVGYGIPLILSSHQLFADRVREYENTDDMVTDGFSATGPEVLIATAFFAQNPCPDRVKVGKCLNRAAPSFKITPVAGNTTDYAFEVNGNPIAYTSDGSGTAQEINTGLESDITALSISGITTTDGATDLDLDMAAGTFLSVKVEPVMYDRLAVLEDTTDPGLAADLAAIAVFDNDWYAVCAPWHSKVINTALAVYAQANKKLALCQTQDSLNAQNTISGTDDVGEYLKANGYTKTRLVYHPQNDKFFGAAEAGRLLPTDPGSATWSDKNLAGVDYYSLTSTQRANLTSRNIGIYERLGLVGRTRNGKTAGGEWVDIIIGSEALITNIQAAAYDVISGSDKLAFTNDGIGAIQSAVRGELFSGTVSVKSKFLSASPAPVVNVPDVADVSDADKAARTLNDVVFIATLAGAILQTTIRGTLVE